jgi:hypothetical protein
MKKAFYKASALLATFMDEPTFVMSEVFRLLTI